MYEGIMPVIYHIEFYVKGFCGTTYVYTYKLHGSGISNKILLLKLIGMCFIQQSDNYKIQLNYLVKKWYGHTPVTMLTMNHHESRVQ